LIRQRFEAIAPFLDERGRRLVAASEAAAAGYGGIAAVAARAQGHQVSHTLVGELLGSLDYSLQGNRKTKEGGNHPDRNAQFSYINDKVAEALAAHQPVISVDTKKKELVGDFKNAGREYRPKGDPEPVLVHDFIIKELGRAVPYGVYDIAANAGWVSVGLDQWWRGIRLRSKCSKAMSSTLRRWPARSA
jgi:Rhodopirellula transposase DDE domain